MPKTIEREVYRFNELSEEAKQAAKDADAEAIGYDWADEAMDSIKALATHFGGQMSDWDIDWWDNTPSHASFDMPEDMEGHEIEDLLAQLGSFDPVTLRDHGDCKLTGYCHDESAIDGFRAEFAKQKLLGEFDLEKLMQAAFKTWLKAAQSDCEYQYSDEAMTENGEANDYWYEASGELAHKTRIVAHRSFQRVNHRIA